MADLVLHEKVGFESKQSPLESIVRLLTRKSTLDSLQYAQRIRRHRAGILVV
jgi:hypothetical protein